MNALNLYYSYINTPYKAPVNPPHFILNVYDGVQKQISIVPVLNYYYIIYIPIEHYYFKAKTYENTTNHARSPPAYTPINSVLLDMHGEISL